LDAATAKTPLMRAADTSPAKPIHSIRSNRSFHRTWGTPDMSLRVAWALHKKGTPYHLFV